MTRRGLGALTVIESISPRSSGSVAGAAIPEVDICVCTYHRPAVADALAALAGQDGRDAIRFRIIVADNAQDPEAQSLVTGVARNLGLDLLYLHAPANNISVARNACLETATADWIAFLDDDERAESGWLRAIIAEAERGSWDAVLGPVQAVYPSSVPRWLKSGDFHSTRPVFVHGRIETGYTGNVLIRRSRIEGAKLRFKPELGRSGGEDVDFFYRLRDAGGRIGFAADALAVETVPPQRANLSWLLKRAFRAGQTHGARLANKSSGPAGRAANFCLASAKAGACAVSAAACLPAVVRRNRFLTRSALHCGVAARLIGISEIKFY